MRFLERQLLRRRGSIILCSGLEANSDDVTSDEIVIEISDGAKSYPKKKCVQRLASYVHRVSANISDVPSQFILEGKM